VSLWPWERLSECWLGQVRGGCFVAVGTVVGVLVGPGAGVGVLAVGMVVSVLVGPGVGVFVGTVVGVDVATELPAKSQAGCRHR
jgi:hypothetical protein